MSDRVPMWLRWWAFKAWFHRCPECGHRPDRHYDSTGPRWEDDGVAKMLGIACFGCRRCGNGCIAERDNAVSSDAGTTPAPAPGYTCPTACVEQNHPGMEHEEWLDLIDLWYGDDDDEAPEPAPSTRSTS